jgi:ABC-type bacteriocin/lantibiotic exporter with double-glycine peptidase domain
MLSPLSTEVSPPDRDRARLPRNLVQVPLVQQAQGFSCGAAVTLSMLRHWRIDAYARVEEAALYDVLRTTHARGTEPEPIVELFVKSGLEAVYRHGEVRVEDLERAVDAREPPIVDLQAWRDDLSPWRETWDAGHYVIMVGYDAERLFFVDPSRATPKGYAYLERSELDERWHDLAGDADAPLERMAIFVRGTKRWVPTDGLPDGASRLG